MDDLTELDLAHAAMEAATEDDALRLAFYERLSDTELFLVLEAEAEEDTVTPATFEVEDQSFVLVFDRVERLAGFVGEGTPYAALSGRALTEMLAGSRVGMGFNLEVAPSAMLIPAEAVDWLADTLAHRPAMMQARPVAFDPPRGLPETLILSLDRKLATAAGLARMAYLAAVTYEDGGRSHLLAFVGAAVGAEDALAAAAGEALTFSGVDAGVMDVAFLRAADPVAAQLARVGLRFDLPEPAAPEGPRAPGMDPEVPPRLR